MSRVCARSSVHVCGTADCLNALDLDNEKADLRRLMTYLEQSCGDAGPLKLERLLSGPRRSSALLPGPGVAPG